MKCIINGIKPRKYTKKDGEVVNGLDLKMLVDNVDVYGKAHKECFISNNSPLYSVYVKEFNDMDYLKGRECICEWDTEMYGTKAVTRLIAFELLPDAYDLVKRGSYKLIEKPVEVK